MKLRWKLLLALVVTIPLAPVLAFKLPVFGAHPDPDDKARFASSAAFNPQKGVFENRRAELFEQMRENSSMVGFITEWFSERPVGAPGGKLPEVKIDPGAFLAADTAASLIWFGHSTFLLNMSGTVILVDPVFSGAAAPVSFTAKRFQPPVLALEELPPVDVVLISHDHYDHLDMQSIKFLANTRAEFLVPLGVGIHLQRWGVNPQQITERDWWQVTSYKGIEFTATPAQHFSGRDGFNNNETLWASWVLASSESRVFYSGDSGYDTHFKTIGEKLGPFDLAILENGQYNQGWPDVHLFPHEAIQAHKDLQATQLLPVHWGMFELAYHTWYDPIVRISELAHTEGIDLVSPRIGEMVTVGEERVEDPWWEELIKQVLKPAGETPAG